MQSIKKNDFTVLIYTCYVLSLDRFVVLHLLRIQNQFVLIVYVKHLQPHDNAFALFACLQLVILKDIMDKNRFLSFYMIIEENVALFCFRIFAILYTVHNDIKGTCVVYIHYRKMTFVENVRNAQIAQYAQ